MGRRGERGFIKVGQGGGSEGVKVVSSGPTPSGGKGFTGSVVEDKVHEETSWGWGRYFSL